MRYELNEATISSLVSDGLAVASVVLHHDLAGYVPAVAIGVAAAVHLVVAYLHAPYRLPRTLKQLEADVKGAAPSVHTAEAAVKAVEAALPHA